MSRTDRLLIQSWPVNCHDGTCTTEGNGWGPPRFYDRVDPERAA